MLSYCFNTRMCQHTFSLPLTRRELSRRTGIDTTHSLTHIFTQKTNTSHCIEAQLRVTLDERSYAQGYVDTHTVWS